MAASKNSSGLGGVLAVMGGGLAILVCCAGPALVAGGALGAFGGLLRSPWLIAAGAVVMLAAAVYTLRRRSRRPRGGTVPVDCCPPVSPVRDRAERARLNVLEEGPHRR